MDPTEAGPSTSAPSGVPSLSPTSPASPLKEAAPPAARTVQQGAPGVRAISGPHLAFRQHF